MKGRPSFARPDSPFDFAQGRIGELSHMGFEFGSGETAGVPGMAVAGGAGHSSLKQADEDPPGSGVGREASGAGMVKRSLG